MKLKLIFLTVLFLLTGCSQHKAPGAGNKVLQFIGYLPPTEVVEGWPAIDRSPSAYSPEEEFYLGRAVSAGILARYKLNTREKITTYLNSVGLIVASASDRPNTFSGYHFALVESNELNAFSAPGGFIFVSTGLFNRLPDEDSLAAVLAHEVAHVERQHGLQAISAEHASSSLSKVGIAAAALSCNQALAQGVLVFGSAVDDVIDRLLVSGYSREQEYEADERALKIMLRAGYNPYALLGVLEILHREEGKNSGGWFATHPAPNDRLDQSQKVIASEQIPPSSQGITERNRRFILNTKS